MCMSVEESRLNSETKWLKQQRSLQITNNQESGARCQLKFNPGFLYAILSFVFASIAVYFYLQRATHRSKSPAEARDMNTECAYLDFYDNHDIWHFFSASGVFMAFMALLTLDDNLMVVPRDKIDVF